MEYSNLKNYIKLCKRIDLEDILSMYEDYNSGINTEYNDIFENFNNYFGPEAKKMLIIIYIQYTFQKGGGFGTGLGAFSRKIKRGASSVKNSVKSGATSVKNSVDSGMTSLKKKIKLPKSKQSKPLLTTSSNKPHTDNHYHGKKNQGKKDDDTKPDDEENRPLKQYQYSDDDTQNSNMPENNSGITKQQQYISQIQNRKKNRISRLLGELKYKAYIKKLSISYRLQYRRKKIKINYIKWIIKYLQKKNTGLKNKIKKLQTPDNNIPHVIIKAKLENDSNISENDLLQYNNNVYNRNKIKKLYEGIE